MCVYQWCLALFGVPWHAVGLRGSRYAPIFPIWPSDEPNAPRIAAQPLNGASLRQKPHKWHNACILVAFSPILVIRGVPVGSGDFDWHAFPPYGLQLTPTPNVLPRNHRMGRRVTETPLRQTPNNGGNECRLVACSHISVVRGVPWRSGVFASHSFPQYGAPLAPKPNVSPRNHRRVYGRRRRTCARSHIQEKWAYTRGV